MIIAHITVIFDCSCIQLSQYTILVIDVDVIVADRGGPRAADRGVRCGRTFCIRFRTSSRLANFARPACVHAR